MSGPRNRLDDLPLLVTLLHTLTMLVIHQSQQLWKKVLTRPLIWKQRFWKRIHIFYQVWMDLREWSWTYMDSRDSSMEAKVLVQLDRTSRVTDSRRIEESRAMDSRTIDSRAMDSRSRWTDMARRWCSMKLCISSSELKQNISKNVCLKNS